MHAKIYINLNTKIFLRLIRYIKKYTNCIQKAIIKKWEKKMNKLKIYNRKIVVQGQSHFIYLPRAYFENGQLDVDELYEITLIPQKDFKRSKPEKAEIKEG